jgi:hypothetical protein
MAFGGNGFVQMFVLELLNQSNKKLEQDCN